MLSRYAILKVSMTKLPLYFIISLEFAREKSRWFAPLISKLILNCRYTLSKNLLVVLQRSAILSYPRRFQTAKAFLLVQENKNNVERLKTKS